MIQFENFNLSEVYSFNHHSKEGETAMSSKRWIIAVTNNRVKIYQIQDSSSEIICLFTSKHKITKYQQDIIYTTLNCQKKKK